MDFLISSAYAQDAVAQPGGLMQFLPLIRIFAVFYFLLIRPQMKRAKEHERMLKRRAKVFLNKFTPHVTDAVRAFTLCQHRARLENAELLENVVAADPVERLRTVEHSRERCAWFIDTEDSDCPYVALDASLSSPDATPPGSGGDAMNGGGASRTEQSIAA